VTDRLRAVLDVNVFLSAFLSRNPSSPTREILQRWQDGEFVLLVSYDVIDELAERLLKSGIHPLRVLEFLTLLDRLAEWITVPEDAVLAEVPGDPDDDPILACAVVGKADYLVTYDTHFESLGGARAGVKITKGLPFLWALRGDQPPQGS
jgi:putative PIN family toxin of toxin-antitoxin system